MFIKVTNGSPEIYTIGQLRRDNPQISFPKDIPDETLEDYSVYRVKETSAPNIDSKTHRHKQSFDLIDGEWTQVWQVIELPKNEAEANVRGYRNRLLAECDWTQGRDIADEVASRWAAYRQALRGIPQQVGFPYDVAWPAKPE